MCPIISGHIKGTTLLDQEHNIRKVVEYSFKVYVDLFFEKNVNEKSTFGFCFLKRQK